MTIKTGLTICLYLILMEAASSKDHALVIDNRIPKFEAFYSQVASNPMDSNSRFALWQKEGGLAAVPPGGGRRGNGAPSS